MSLWLQTFLLDALYFLITEWVKSVWDSDFTEGEELQDDVLKELDSAALIEALHRLGKNLTHWLTDDTDEGIYIIKIIH